MLSSTLIMLLLFYIWILIFITNTFSRNCFNRQLWFNDGNIFHIDQKPFQAVFQQHRNVNRHINWLNNEISLLNHRIKLVKAQVAYVVHPQKQHKTAEQENNNIVNGVLLSTNNNSQKISSNQQNVYVIKLLSRESLFDEYLQDLIHIYETSLTKTIECVAIFSEENSNRKYLFIKLSNGNVDAYQVDKTKPLNETYLNINQPISSWMSAGRQLEHYLRFFQHNQTNEITFNDQLRMIKNRPKLNGTYFFKMFSPIIQIKYHVDPSNPLCILEDLFGNIYTCDGRLIYPDELEVLFHHKDQIALYAVMVNTIQEKQIYPLATNNHIRKGDQIYFLFDNHPRLMSLSSRTCDNCTDSEEKIILNSLQKFMKENAHSRQYEFRQVDHIERNQSFVNSQNCIVYAIVTSISVYILFSFYSSRKQESTKYLVKKRSMSSRRGR